MRLKAPISGIMGEAQAIRTSDAFTRAATLLSGMNADIREETQASTSNATQKLIGKLRALEQLDSDDLEVLRLWIVGDAESHIAMENNYNDWLKEFERIKSVAEQYEERELSSKDLFGLQGLLQDAMRTAADISDFLEKKERIEKFEAASKEINSESAGFLIELLSTKLSSPEF